jgi:hypothetical protein
MSNRRGSPLVHVGTSCTKYCNCKSLAACFGSRRLSDSVTDTEADARCSLKSGAADQAMFPKIGDCAQVCSATGVSLAFAFWPSDAACTRTDRGEEHDSSWLSGIVNARGMCSGRSLVWSKVSAATMWEQTKLKAGSWEVFRFESGGVTTLQEGRCGWCGLSRTLITGGNHSQRQKGYAGGRIS